MSSSTTAAPAAAWEAAAGDDVAAAQLADQGAELAAQGHFAEAAAVFEQALQLGPANAAAVHEMLAQCHMEAGQDEAAYEAAAAAVRLAPGWHNALLTLGRAARNVGRLHEAAAAFGSYLEQLTAAPPRTTEAGAAEAAINGATAGCAAAEEAEEAAAVQQELHEVQQLLQLRLGHQIGLPGLRLLERPGAEVGPGGMAWEAGALLAYFLVQQARGSSCTGSAAQEAQHSCQQCCSGSGSSNGTTTTSTDSAAHASVTPFLAGSRVLELGAGGTGVVGITAACLGADVTATDLPPVLPQLAASAALNSHMVSAAGGSLQAAVLDWAQPDEVLLAQQYDWLVGADLVYSLEPVGPLVATIARAAERAAALAEQKQPPLKVLISHKHRHEEVDHALLGQLRAAGLPLRAVLRDAGTRCTVYASDAACAALSHVPDA